jgi:hypothetical protein
MSPALLNLMSTVGIPGTGCVHFISRETENLTPELSRLKRAKGELSRPDIRVIGFNRGPGKRLPGPCLLRTADNIIYRRRNDAEKQ